MLDSQTDFDTLWLLNIAMENGPFIDDFPMKTSIYSGLSMAMLNTQMVSTSQIPPSNSCEGLDRVGST